MLAARPQAMEVVDAREGWHEPPHQRNANTQNAQQITQHHVRRSDMCAGMSVMDASGGLAPTGPAAAHDSPAEEVHQDRADVCLTWAAMEQGGLATLEFQSAFQTDAANQERLVGDLGRVLDATLLASSSSPVRWRKSCPMASFESDRPCPLSPSQYLSRMMRYTAISPCNLMVGIMYLQRLHDRKDEAGALRLSPFNYQRLLLCANMLGNMSVFGCAGRGCKSARVACVSVRASRACRV